MITLSHLDWRFSLACDAFARRVLTAKRMRRERAKR